MRDVETPGSLGSSLLDLPLGGLFWAYPWQRDCWSPEAHLALRPEHCFPVCVAVSSVTSHFPLVAAVRGPLIPQAYFCFSPHRCQQLAAHLRIPAAQRDTWLSQARHRCHGTLPRAGAHTDENPGMGQQQGNFLTTTPQATLTLSSTSCAGRLKPATEAEAAPSWFLPDSSQQRSVARQPQDPNCSSTWSGGSQAAWRSL